MASTSFKVISWSPGDVITDYKLGALVNNDQWLRDNSLRARYVGHGVSRSENIRMLTGLVQIPSGKAANASKSVSFNGFFSDGCHPIVTTGIVSSSQRQIFATIDGPGKNLQPDRSGFTMHVHVNSNNKKQKISRNFYVSWHAIGY